MDPTGQYENLVTISSFKREFRLAGGMNLPKIIDCVGSDGKERRQLVKVGSVSCNDISETWHAGIIFFLSSPVSLPMNHFCTMSRLFTLHCQFSQLRKNKIAKY